MNSLIKIFSLLLVSIMVLIFSVPVLTGPLPAEERQTVFPLSCPVEGIAQDSIVDQYRVLDDQGNPIMDVTIF